MKINLMTKRSNYNINIKKIFFLILVFIFILCILINIYFKINNLFNLKAEYEKITKISNINDNYQDKYNKKREELLEINNKKKNWGLILNTLYSKVPDNVLITKIEYKNNVFSIYGTTKEKNQIFIFIEELKKIQFCSEVYIDDLKSENKILYTIKFLLDG
ncbi:MAG: PilN domain-containing protein [Bacillota bacterium]